MAAPFAFIPKVTDAGRAAATAGPVTLTHVALGMGRYVPTGAETAVTGELVRLPLTGAMRELPNQMRVAGVWNDPVREAPFYEIGFYAGAVLLAVWSSEATTPVGIKPFGMDFVLMAELHFDDLPDGSVLTGDNPAVNEAVTRLVEHEIDAQAHPQYLRRQDFVDAFVLATAETVAGTGDEIEVELPGETVFDSYRAGQQIAFVAGAANSANVTLAVNGLDPLPMLKVGGLQLEANDLKVGVVYTLFCDGTRWHVMSGIDSGAAMLVTILARTYTAAPGQTIFPASYAPGWLMVTHNGRALPPSGYTANDGVSVVLAEPALAGDSITTLAFRQFHADDAYTKAQGDARFLLRADLGLHREAGRVGYFATGTPPAGWLRANGALVSRAAYAELFAAIGTTHGEGDGTTTFQLPDLRGEFLRGLDDARGVDAGRAIGSWQADGFRSHKHATVDGSRYSHSPPNGSGSTTYGFLLKGSGIPLPNLKTGMTGGSETRPRNVAMLACIRY